MRGRSAHRLAAELGGDNALTYLCEPFKTATVHVLHTSVARGYPNYYNLGNCDNSSGWPSTQEGGTIPNMIGGLSSALGSGHIGAVYGQTGENATPGYNPDKVMTFPNVYFNLEDLDRWLFRRNTNVFNPPMERNGGEPLFPDNLMPPNYVTGPGLASAHAFYPVHRRTACDPQYSNYLNWCFTDYGTLHMLRDGQPQCPEDWLGFSYPAKPIWHNADIDQPFLSFPFWEDNGTVPINVATPEGRGFIPFCTPITAYTKNGEALGQYVGYSHIVFFNNNFYVGANDQGKKNAEDPGNLPADFTSPLSPQPPVKRWKDAHCMDVHIYMVARPNPGKTLKSPKLGSKRFWRPNNVLGYQGYPQGVGICPPSVYFLCGFIYDDWAARIKFNVLNSSQVSRVLSFGTFTAYLVP